MNILRETRVGTNNLHAVRVFLRRDKKKNNGARSLSLSLNVQLQITLSWQMGYYANSQSSSPACFASQLFARTVRRFWNVFFDKTNKRFQSDCTFLTGTS